MNLLLLSDFFKLLAITFMTIGFLAAVREIKKKNAEIERLKEEQANLLSELSKLKSS